MFLESILWYGYAFPPLYPLPLAASVCGIGIVVQTTCGRLVAHLWQQCIVICIGAETEQVTETGVERKVPVDYRRALDLALMSLKRNAVISLDALHRLRKWDSLFPNARRRLCPPSLVDGHLRDGRGDSC